MTRQSDLVPLSPSEGIQRFLEHRKSGVAKSTYQNNKTVLEQFGAWCADEDIENLNDLSGRDLANFVQWRRQEVKALTLQKQLSAVREALGFWAALDAVEQGLRERVHAPEIVDGSEARDVKVDADHADEILDYLGRFHYASRDHVIIVLLWQTGIRLGALHSLDVDDLHEDEEAFELVHRPDTDTPLKNGSEGERWVWLGPLWYQALTDYVENTRFDVCDEYGREPLLTSQQGRLSKSSIRNVCYRVTQPCMLGACPHDREPETCEAVADPDKLSKCPSARSPHAYRRGSITDHLNRGVSAEVVSERMNVSLGILYKHYDARQPDEKMAVRRRHLKGK